MYEFSPHFYFEKKDTSTEKACMNNWAKRWGVWGWVSSSFFMLRSNGIEGGGGETTTEPHTRRIPEFQNGEKK